MIEASQQLQSTLTQYGWIVLLLQIVAIGAIGWCIHLMMTLSAGYAQEKGKNRATSEDFDKLLVQQSRTEDALERIRSEIATGAWLQQRQWDLKREIYTEWLDAFYGMRLHFQALASHYEEPIDSSTPVEEARAKIAALQKDNKAWEESMQEMSRAIARGALLVPSSAIDAANKFRELAMEMRKVSDPKAYLLGMADKAEEVYSIALTVARGDLLSSREG